MFKIIVTIILVSAFFILFFNPTFELQNKTESKREVSTTAGFIEDTEDAFIIPMYPSQLLKRDAMGKLKPIYGDTGTFVAYSTIPDEHWMSGFPHKSTGIKIEETATEKLERRIADREERLELQAKRIEESRVA